MPKIRILLVDDHALVRSGLRALLHIQPDLEVVGEAEDGVVVIEQCKQLAPDVVLMDLTMPGRGGLAAIREVGHACPGAKVLVVTMHADETYLHQALLAGATGYVLKKSLANELIKAIHEVHHGRQYISLALAQAVRQSAKNSISSPKLAGALDLLTPREREIVEQIALGRTNLEMARLLHISEKTVETHRKNTITKLNLRTRADIVRFALENKLLRS